MGRMTPANSGHSKPVFLLSIRRVSSRRGDVFFPVPPKTLFGFPFRHLVRESVWLDLLHPHDAVRFPALGADAQKSPDASWSYRVRHADGRYHRWHEEVRLVRGSKNSAVQQWVCAFQWDGLRVPARVRELARKRLADFIKRRKSTGSSARPKGKSMNLSNRRRDAAKWPPSHSGQPQVVPVHVEALCESEAKYRRLHESMMDAFVSVDMAGHILDFNPAFQSLLGYSGEQLRRLSYTALVPERWHHLEECIVREQVLRRGYSDVYEKEFRRADGTLIAVELRTVLIREAGAPAAMWAIVRDISQRKEAEQALRDMNTLLEQRVAERTAALRESEARFRELAAITPEGIAITEGAVLLDGNPQLAAMLGYELSEIIGRPISDFIPRESREAVAEQIREGVDEPYEGQYQQRDGTVIPVAVHGRAMLWQGKPRRVTILRDLRASRESAKELESLRASLDRSRRLAEFAEVSAGMVHQLGQPLSAMTGNMAAVKLAVNGCTQPNCAVAATVAEVDDELKRARQTVNRLRALAHPERPLRKPANLNLLVEDVIRLLQAEAAARETSFQTRFGKELVPVPVDEVQLSQALLNLLRNAMDAVASCTGRRRVIRVATQRTSADTIEINIVDSGAGIDPEHLPRLFEPFFTTKPDGMGVGLPLAQTIVNAHGGTLQARNNKDHGATFSILLPSSGRGA